jgi:hypothetical protein
MQGMDTITAMYEREENEDAMSVPDVDGLSDIDSECDFDAQDATSHTQSEDARARNVLREMLASIKSASYDISLEAVLAATVVLQPLHNKMVDLMSVDLDLRQRSGRNQSGL